MTEVVKMTAPHLDGAKDPNDARNDPRFRRYLETEVKGNPTVKPSSFDPVQVPVESYQDPTNKESKLPDLGGYRASDRKGKVIKPREWVWDKWASAGVVTGLSGAPVAAKSLFAQQICTHSATGTA